jgi:glycosyltransferase involved in cell wall biosynthesis
MLLGTARASRSLELDGLPFAVCEPSRPGLLGRLARRIRPQGRRLDPSALKAAEAHAPRLVHAHFGPDGVLAAQIAQALQIPLLVTLHGYDVRIDPAHWASGAMGAHMVTYPQELRQLANRCEVRFIAVSESIRQRAIQAYGLDPDRIDVSYIGVDTQRFSYSPAPVNGRPMTVLCVGRLVEKKGIDVLIRASAVAKEDLPGLRVKVIGDGPLAGALKTLADELGAPVEFLGLQPPSAVAAHLADARLFCLPSVTAASGDAEGFGLVILEAQARGVPVVTSAIGGAEEGIVHGQTGFTFAEHDHETLARIMSSSMADADLLERVRVAARASVEARFDLHHCTALLERLYDSAGT